MTSFSRYSRNARVSEIQRICTERKIETLVHFTRIQNLSSILQRGLLGRRVLENQSYDIRPQYNDLYRIDGYKEAICLSISFPNYQMFYRYSNSDRQNWVVLLLRASLLWNLDCAFCQENAASNSVTQIPIEVRKESNALQQMFSDYRGIDREKLRIPDNYPTHPQAEVLVFERIEPRYIHEVQFYNLESAQNWLNNQQAAYTQEFYYGDHFFRPRQDYQVWSPTRQDVISEDSFF